MSHIKEDAPSSLNLVTLDGQTSCWLRDKCTCSHAGPRAPASRQICRNLICHMFPLQPAREQVEQWMVRTTRRRKVKTESWVTISGTQISPEATAISCLRLLNATAFAGSLSSTGSFFWHSFAFDVGKTWVLRFANIRLGFQVKWESGEGMKQSQLCLVWFLILKKTLNEQVEITSPRIYEQASNPAQWHGRGPVGRGGELIFPFYW